ncbi:MAG TPA: acyl-CoA dehydrogenase [Myxococcota bacterium]|nr:acyl-CoA dehydrogenase [Myxococcota bacterium]
MPESRIVRGRRRWITRALMPRIATLLPRLGATERIALEAGSVGWDGQLFSGAPDWPALFDFRPAPLSPAEQAFLAGPVEDLCARLDDWLITRTGDLPEEIWEFLRRERFFGLIIPERYGGRGFSAQAHAAVLRKLASRSLTAAVTVMVPNSLGPAELLLHYGTDAQRDYYLPRLACGEEIPCFALTGPEAGSDAAATQSEGIVCRDKWRDEEVLGIRLRWCKRYITLAPVATLIGLAFRLRDPDRLLGNQPEPGITCALIPAGLRGIAIGARHDPMGIPFQNGPTSGEDVFVPLDAIIGGPAGAGQGWKMLMECLATGRALSLPSLAVAAAKVSARAVSAYAVVREQFDTPIGWFEGVEEPLARIAGLTYAIDAASHLTAAAIDAGERPAVLSAITKAYCTELMRDVVNDAMDIRAGAEVMRGPRNILATAYASIPIAITVEGANILTRSMIIYGQGAIRCHPFALEEMRAVADDDLARFDRAFFGHFRFAIRTAVRAFALAITRGRLDRRAPADALRRHIQRLAAASASFALVSEAAMATLGERLKRRETITGRLADALAWLYLGSAVVKRFRDAGELARERPLAQWATERALAEIENALAGVLRHFPSRPAAWLLGALVFPLGRRELGPDDALGAKVAETLLGDDRARESLTAGIFVPPASEAGLGGLEAALAAVRPALAIERRIEQAVRDGELAGLSEGELAKKSVAIGLITEAEMELLARADRARVRAIEVDAFDPDEFRALRR